MATRRLSTSRLSSSITGLPLRQLPERPGIVQHPWSCRFGGGLTTTHPRRVVSKQLESKWLQPIAGAASWINILDKGHQSCISAHSVGCCSNQSTPKLSFLCQDHEAQCANARHSPAICVNATTWHWMVMSHKGLPVAAALPWAKHYYYGSFAHVCLHNDVSEYTAFAPARACFWCQCSELQVR